MTKPIFRRWWNETVRPNSAPSFSNAGGPLDRITLVAFAGPAAPIAAMGLPLVVYLPPFYAREMGLGLTLVGTIFMIARFWDVLTDPFLGIVSDKFETRWGRRRHWIAASVPIMLVSTVMIFMPTAVGFETVSGAYLLGWMVILYIGWTLLTLSHMSWGAELSPHYDERSRIQGAREIALLVGMVLVLLLPAMIERAQPENLGTARVAAMGWFVLVVLPLTVAVALWRVPEHGIVPPKPVPWRQALFLLAANSGLRRLLGADLAVGVAGGIVSALFLFLAEDALKLGAWSSVLLLLYFTAGAVFIPLILRISYRFGKHRTLAGSSSFNAVMLPLILAVPEGNVGFALLCWVLFGVNMGAGPFLMRSIMADVADDDHVRTGAQRTGLFYAMLTMTNKVGYAVAVGLSYAALDAIGFTPGGENTPAAVAGLKAVYVWPASALSLVTAAIVWNFPIDKVRQVENRRLLAEHAAASSSGSSA